ncbi:MAG: ester cyclase [Actinomycetota bacterium]
MSKENESVFRRWVEEVWNNGKEATIEELFDADGIAEYQYFVGNKPLRGRNRFKGFVRLMRKMFTDLDVTIEQIAADEKKVLAVCQVTAKRRSKEIDGLTTYKSITVSGLCQMIFENGRIIREWNNINLLENSDSTENNNSQTV